MPGTDLKYRAGIGLRARYAKPGTDLAHAVRNLLAFEPGLTIRRRGVSPLPRRSDPLSCPSETETETETQTETQTEAKTETNPPVISERMCQPPLTLNVTLPPSASIDTDPSLCAGLRLPPLLRQRRYRHRKDRCPPSLSPPILLHLSLSLCLSACSVCVSGLGVGCGVWGEGLREQGPGRHNLDLLSFDAPTCV